ncbi:hypothetical protein BDY24DRAFT_170944 [Mrakia frigida]|uniref:uncharacterized protein n=1 Tax=Mrakia frigida TaxID=29902 RepID=UPI003FCC2141
MGITRACLLPGRRPRASSSSTRSYFVAAPRPLVLLLPSSSSSSSFNTSTSSSPSKRYQSTSPSKPTPSSSSSSSSNPLRPVWSILPTKPMKEDVPELKSASWQDAYLEKPSATPTSFASTLESFNLSPSKPKSSPPPPQSASTPFHRLIPAFLSSSPDTLAAPKDSSSISSAYAPPEDGQEDSHAYSSSSEPYHYIPTDLFKNDPSYRSLDALLLTPTVHPDLYASQEALDRSDKIWEVYGTVTNHRSLPASAWTALLSNVVPPQRVASRMTGKENEFGSTAQYGSAVLTNYLRRGYETRFHRIMQDKAKAGLEPLREEFRLIMEHFAPNGYVKGVESVFAAMVLKGLDPEPRDYELRLEAVVNWLRRYQSLEAESLIAEGVLHPFELALSSVPDLVGTIMASLNTASFTPTLSRQTVDLACELFAQTGDAKAFNLLVRYEYGVDLDVPDAIPEEFLARMQQGEDVRRGLSNAGLQSALKLWEKEGNFYKMLSMFEVFAFPLPMPEGTPEGLHRKPSWRSTSVFTLKGKSYAPPLPPTTAVSMMSLEKVPVVVASSSSSDPQPNLVGSEPTTSSSDPTTSSSTSSTSSTSSPLPPSSKSTSYTFQPRDPSLSFLEASQGNVAAETYTQLLQGPCSSSGPLNTGDIFLSKHILTRALAHHYTSRQHRVGRFLHILSLAPDDRVGRNSARLKLDPTDTAKARIEWFVMFSKCCSRNPGREAFEALRWAEKELNALRGAWELDIEVMKRVIEICEEDDEIEEEERKMGLNGNDPTRSREFRSLSSFFRRRVSILRS